MKTRKVKVLPLCCSQLVSEDEMFNMKAFGFQFVSQFHCRATYRRKSASDQKKVVANQMGNTNFALTTDGYQMVVVSRLV